MCKLERAKGNRGADASEGGPESKRINAITILFYSKLKFLLSQLTCLNTQY